MQIFEDQTGAVPDYVQVACLTPDPKIFENLLQNHFYISGLGQDKAHGPEYTTTTTKYGTPPQTPQI